MLEGAFPYRISDDFCKDGFCQLVGIRFLLRRRNADRLEEVCDRCLVHDEFLDAGADKPEDFPLRLPGSAFPPGGALGRG
jgi:hypothetical protein